MKTSTVMKAVPASNPSPAREALAANDQGPRAAAIRAGLEADAAAQVARDEVAALEREMEQHEAAARNAPNKQIFAAARLDADFTRQRLSEAQQRVNVAEDRRRATAQQIADLEKQRAALVVDVLMEEARGHESELHRLEAECVQRFARLDATLNHFRAHSVTGKPVEELAAIFERLRAFAILKDEHRASAQATLRELLDNLN